MVKFHVLVLDKIGNAGMNLLNSIEDFNVEVRTDLNGDELGSYISNYDVIILRSRVKITGELISKARKLKVIARAGVGLDNIDLTAAESQGVQVVNVTGGNSISVAEHTFALMLALARKIPHVHSQMIKHNWCKKEHSGIELFDKTLGIIGFGAIGRKVAQIAKTFRMNVLVFDPFLPEEHRTRHSNFTFADFNELLTRSDFITMHVPLNEDTRHLFTLERLMMCKKGCFLINTARGGIIDEKALEMAIKGEHIGGAALDVFENEPNISYSLIELPQVIATPHIAANTVEAQNFISTELIKKIQNILIQEKGGE